MCPLDKLPAGMRDRLLRHFLAIRSVCVFGFALLLLSIIGHIRPNDETGMAADFFWVSKAAWRQCAEIVLAGDSRICIGVSPCEMRRFLPGARILNYGFLGAGYSKTYLDALEQVLDSTSSQRIIILGITPLSLTNGSCINSRFVSTYGKFSKWKTNVYKYFSVLFHCIRPLEYTEVLRKVKYHRKFYEDGWAACYRDPEDRNESIPHYTQIFRDDKNGTVSQDVIDRLMNAVSQWHNSGITVYGLRMPSSFQIIELENSYSMFDEADFKDRFVHAGGKWLDFDQYSYDSYDGSHLHQDAALRLSRELACIVAELTPWKDGLRKVLQKKTP